MPDARRPRVWVVGAGGLLGRAVTRLAADAELFAARTVPWSDGEQAAALLSAELERFGAGLGPDDAWCIVWAAGAGVIATSPDKLAAELVTFEAFVRALADRTPPGRGSLFLSSSASVFAGSPAPPFDELTPVHPTSAYASTKLRQEELAASLLAGRARVAVGRFSTLYGPGQRLDKPQGLISQMCVQAAMNRPISIYVPMDTLRDYLYVDDAAALVWECVRRLCASDGEGEGVRVLASERATTIAELVHVVQNVTHSRVGLTQRIGTAPGHIRDLRLRSTRPLDRPSGIVPLPVGVRRTADAVLRAHREGTLAAAVAGPLR
ncbi:NAD-dependent epimerase/dehydratase family protein [Cellulomonas sp. 179-A 4D5 NHS]|uniref:NAD-dependent epimerase/dehydratase family protein n=1 Tax=Cellulomonas sp. 179-A 4D5 NHS TaxID=3142378 RepID=UPI0039A176AA